MRIALARFLDVGSRNVATSPGLRALAVTSGALAFVLAWLIVHLSPLQAATLVLGGFGATLWVLFPSSPVYLLAVICPFLLAFEAAGLDLRAHDAPIGALSAAVVLSIIGGASRLHRFRDLPARALLALWIFLAAWGSMTFLVGPANQGILRDAIHNTWYVYKGVWRAILPFPLVAYCLSSRDAARRVLNLLLGVCMLVALYAIFASMQSGMEATGPFDKKNQLAGFLVPVIPLVMARLVLEEGWLLKGFYAVAALGLVRAVWLTGSRGGVVAFIASLLPLVALIPRQRLMGAGAACILMIVLVVIAKPDLLDRPLVRRFLTLTNPAAVENMRWREAQWKLILAEIQKRPWLGTGSDIDETIKADDPTRAATAHNSYLGITLQSGVPAVAAWVLLLTVWGVMSFRHALRASEARDRAFWIGVLGFLVATLTHNMVETALLMPQVQLLLWMVLAVSLMIARRSPEIHAPAEAVSG